jgi:uracil-DNA glycosylase family 4
MESALTPGLRAVERDVVSCRKCPRLVAWREQVAREKRRAFADEEYWGRPVPGWGDPAARLLVLGLAPAAHGGNRTGRAFTGDESGRWLYRALWRSGFANQPECERKGDGLALRDCFITAAVRCAPPANRPTTAERDNCRPWLEAELDLLPRIAVVVTLGAFAFDNALRVWGARGAGMPRPKPRFGHGVEVPIDLPLRQKRSRRRPARIVLLGCYHPSQQNTFTGVLTEPMLDAVFVRARMLLDGSLRNLR